MSTNLNTLLELLANPDRLFTVNIGHNPSEFLFDSLQGRDALSSLSTYTVRLLHPSIHVDIESLLGQSLSVVIETMTVPRYLNGLISHIALLGEEDTSHRYYVYEARVVPWLWLSTLKKEFRIYQDLTITEIITQVLTPYESPFKWELQSRYPSYEYCVQYDETDFHFISRLLEREGIHYYFKHESDKHTLLLTDIVETHKEVPGYEQVPYFNQDTLVRAQRDYMFDLALYQNLRPGRYETNDYDFKVSRALLQSRHTIKRQHAKQESEIYEWPGNYTDWNEGERYAINRMSEQHYKRDYKTLRSTARGVETGALFTLIHCPRRDENRQYLVLSTEYDLKENNYHSLNSETSEKGGRRCLFTLTLQDAQLPFVPRRRTPKPRTSGPQTARVVGPAGQEI